MEWVHQELESVAVAPLPWRRRLAVKCSRAQLDRVAQRLRVKKEAPELPLAEPAVDSKLDGVALGLEAKNDVPELPLAELSMVTPRWNFMEEEATQQGADYSCLSLASSSTATPRRPVCPCTPVSTVMDSDEEATPAGDACLVAMAGVRLVDPSPVSDTEVMIFFEEWMRDPSLQPEDLSHARLGLAGVFGRWLMRESGSGKERRERWAGSMA